MLPGVDGGQRRPASFANGFRERRKEVVTDSESLVPEDSTSTGTGNQTWQCGD